MVAPLARYLARRHGVLEPLQTATTVDGQVAELAATLRAEGAGPYRLVGHSWGGMLAVLTAQRHPELTERLVLVGCAPFDPAGGLVTEAVRRARMSPSLRAELDDLDRIIDGDDPQAARVAFATVADRLLAIDQVDPTTDHLEVIAHQPEVFRSVWQEVEERRSEGTLLDELRRLRCPVVVIHGDHDPHPLSGVRDPLRRFAADLQVVLLDDCGHVPWLERHAAARFLDELDAAVT